MPRYEYKCKKCHKSFEAVHGIHDNVEKCEYCGGPVRRVFHPVGIVFKGSGFYATDSKKPGYATKTANGDSSAEAGKTPEPAGSESSKKESKEKKDKGGKKSGGTASKPS